MVPRAVPPLSVNSLPTHHKRLQLTFLDTSTQTPATHIPGTRSNQ